MVFEDYEPEIVFVEGWGILSLAGDLESEEQNHFEKKIRRL
jgi:hypothetical protein